MNNKLQLPVTLEKLLNYRYIFPLTLIVIVFLFLPTLSFPLSGDDYFHRLIFDKYPSLQVTSPLLDLFKFARGDPEFMAESIAKSGVVWWADPNLKISFLRPLTAVSHWIDYLLWPDSLKLARLHSLFLYLANIAIAFALYKTIFKNNLIATLGLLIFSLSIHHYVPIAWIAARNAILTACFSMLTFLVYYKACAEHWKLGFILTPLCLALALLCGEASLSITAFLFSCAIFIDSRKKHIALLSLLPAALVALIWLYMYQKLGYGSANSGYYIAPQDNPIEYIQRTIINLPILITGAIFNIPPNFSTLSQLTKYSFFFFALISLSFTFYKLILPYWKKDKFFAFWITSLVISLLPACAVSPGSRTLIIPGIAAIGLILSVFQNALKNKSNFDKVSSFSLKVILFLRLILPVITYITFSISAQFINSSSLGVAPKLTEINLKKEQTLLHISSDYMQTVKAITYIAAHKISLPKQSINLFSPEETFKLYRPSNNELIASSQKTLIKKFNTTQVSQLFRDLKNKPLHIGEKFQAGTISIEILELNEKLQPTSMKFTFPNNMSGDEYFWLTTHLKEDHFETMKIPTIGETKEYELSKPVDK